MDFGKQSDGANVSDGKRKGWWREFAGTMRDRGNLTNGKTRGMPRDFAGRMTDAETWIDEMMNIEQS